jgi:REP-associated tyrosine transposase
MAGVPVHVTQRGNRRHDVFFTDDDRQLYLSKLREYSTQYHLRLLGYCLMTNHVHLIAVPGRPNSLAKALGRAHHDYTRWLHIRRGWVGHLWQNRFFSCPLDAAHRWEALRYVELNPVRAGLVRRADDWPWSSARAHLAEASSDDERLLDLTPWRDRYGAARWREALESSVSDVALRDRIREATRTGRPLGSAEFVDSLECALKRRLRPAKPGPKPALKDVRTANLSLFDELEA